MSVGITGLRYAEAQSWTLGGYAVGNNAGNESAFSVFMSDVILLDNGTYRMYYGAAFQSSTAIKYAESSDGASWTVKGIVLQGASSQSDPEYLVSGPSVLRLPDGRYRMYYQSAPQITPNETAKYHVRSAISSDGLAFTKENGVRLNINSYDSASPLRLAGHGTYFIASDGTYVGIFSGEFTSDTAGPSDLKMATSADGLTFGNLQTLYTDWHDPIVIKANGQYRMYATYLLEKQGSAVSLNGLNWSSQISDEMFIDSSGNTLTEANSGVGDIGGVLLSSGVIRLYTNYGTAELSRDIVYFDCPLCNLVISSTSITFASTSETAGITVTGSGAWTATSSLNWATITSGSSGTGNGTVTISVSANTTGATRTGNITIAGQTVTITQNATQPVLLVTTTPASQTSYDTIQTAYNANTAVSGSSILVQGATLSEALVFNQNNSITLTGGYDSYFSVISATMTTVQGSLTISGGAVTVANIVIQ